MSNKEEKAAAKAAKDAEKAAAKAAKDAEKAAAKAAGASSSESEVIGDIEVGDPQLLRPVELPLVVKPANGGAWANEAQAEYAAILNAYAYKNPQKWAKKKNDKTINTPAGPKVIPGLISQLARLADEPEHLAFLKGEQDPAAVKLSYKDKRIQQ